MISIEINDAEVSAVLARISSALSDLTPVMQDAGEMLVASTKSRFKTSEAPDGTPWAPKTQATLDAYARRGDRLDFRPLFGPTGRLSSEISFSADQDSVEWGSNMIYAAVMHFGAKKGAFGQTSKGGPIPWGNIPARPFLGISDQDQTNLVDMVEEWLKGVVSTGG